MLLDPVGDASEKRRRQHEAVTLQRVQIRVGLEGLQAEFDMARGNEILGDGQVAAGSPWREQGI